MSFQTDGDIRQQLKQWKPCLRVCVLTQGSARVQRRAIILTTSDRTEEVLCAQHVSDLVGMRTEDTHRICNKKKRVHLDLDHI